MLVKYLKRFFVSHDLVPSINVVPYTTAYIGIRALVRVAQLTTSPCLNDCVVFVLSNEVLDLEPNFTDHLPVMLTFNQQFAKDFVGTNAVIKNGR